MNTFFTKFARWVSELLGSPVVISLAIALLILWALLGPRYDFSRDWRDVVKLSAAIITLITTFLLRYNQIRDTKAIQIKLDELLRVKREARDELINLENCTDEELDQLEHEFKQLKKKRGKLR